MTTFRLWSRTHRTTGAPTPNATADWWQWCDDCHHLDGPHAEQQAARDATHVCGSYVARSRRATA